MEKRLPKQSSFFRDQLFVWLLFVSPSLLENSSSTLMTKRDFWSQIIDIDINRHRPVRP
jgi:hypothetical protein